MTFRAFEDSEDQGIPVELFQFRHGTGESEVERFTDLERAFSYGGNLWTPVPIARSNHEISGDRARKDMTITVSGRNPIVDLFQVYPPDQAISVLIHSGHVGDDDKDFQTIYSGRVISVKIDADGTADILCRTLASAGRQAGLRRNYQFGCPHVLYGEGCKASQAAATTTVSTVGVGLTSITLADGWSAGIDTKKYNGGMVTWDDGTVTRSRTVLRQSGGNTLHLSGPTTGLASGGSVNMVLGCNHQMGDCYNLHDNLPNFGGQPWIPFTNPINTNPY